jgi:hypothetical protein
MTGIDALFGSFFSVFEQLLSLFTGLFSGIVG